MSPGDADDVTSECFTLLANDRAPREARARVTAFDTLPPRVRVDACLVISEIITNSVRYGGLQLDDHIDVWLSLEGQHLVIEVDDHGSMVRATYTTPRRPAGVGLTILGTVCDYWDAQAGHMTARIPL